MGNLPQRYGQRWDVHQVEYLTRSSSTQLGEHPNFDLNAEEGFP